MARVRPATAAHVVRAGRALWRRQCLAARFCFERCWASRRAAWAASLAAFFWASASRLAALAALRSSRLAACSGSSAVRADRVDEGRALAVGALVDREVGDLRECEALVFGEDRREHRLALRVACAVARQHQRHHGGALLRDEVGQHHVHVFARRVVVPVAERGDRRVVARLADREPDGELSGRARGARSCAGRVGRARRRDASSPATS